MHLKTSSLHILLQVATCYHMLGQLQDAAGVYETSTSHCLLFTFDVTYSVSSTLFGSILERRQDAVGRDL
jgi:hypothetical protein